jgi:hypothetical protein
MSAQDFMTVIRSGGGAMAVILLSALLALGVAIERLIALFGVIHRARDLGDAVARHLFRRGGR